MKTAMEQLGMPDAPDKTIPPTTRLNYLGICIDSVQMSISLDQQRVDSTVALLDVWRARTHCSLRQLQSICGTLSWCAQVVRHGRTFLQHLRDLASLHQDVHSPNDATAIALTADCHDDLSWWRRYMSQWNGVSLLWEEQQLDTGSVLQPHTDACVEGYAAVCGTQWFHRRWTAEQEHLARDGGLSRDSMPWKELYAIVAAAATWGHLWQRKLVCFFTDCMPVVQSVLKGASRTRRIMQLIRQLHFYAATHHFVYRIQHIPGVENVIADELSRVHVISQLSTRCRSNIDPSPTTPVLPPTPP
jgi:hypothetical protein